MSASRTPGELPAGLRYMVEHGHAADGSHGDNTEPTQHLVNPPVVNPTRREVVADWVRARVEADHQMRAPEEST